METPDQVLERIAELVQRIRKESKIGTAYEKYDTQHLWDLGEQIRIYRSLAVDKRDTTAEILQYLASHSIICLPVLLKNAETARRAWPARESFLRVAKDVSYGKLKAVLPIFDPDFLSRAKVSTEDLNDLSKTLSKSTYEQVLEKVAKLRNKYDRTGVAIDFDEFYQELYLTTEELRQIVERQQRDALEEFRRQLTPEFIESSRRLMAAVKNEDVFARLVSEIPKNFTQNLDTESEDLRGHLFKIIKNTAGICQTSKMREQLRRKIGIARLGELSTLMKAASSDEELQRYLRGQKLLEQIRTSTIKRG